MDNLKKLAHIFRSPALRAVARWAGCVRRRLLAVCLITVACILCSLATTVVTRHLIDSATSSDGGALLKCGILLASLTLFERLMAFFSSMLRVRMSARLQKNLQGSVLSEMLTREYSGLKRYHSGQLVSRVFSDVNVVKAGITGILPRVVGMLVSFTGAVTILLSMDPRLMIALLVGGFAGAGMMLLFKDPMKKRHGRMQEAESRLQAAIQETLENIRLIKASLSEGRMLRRVGGAQDVLEREQCRQGIFSAGVNSGLGLMFDASWLICMLWGCVSIYRGNLTYGSLAAIIQLIGRIQGPIAGAADVAAQAYGVISSAERLQEILDIPEEAGGEPVTDFSGIRLDNVSFRYEDGTECVLDGLNEEIRKGDFVALTGISGGGKTSLFQLLLGIYAPVSGSVCFETEEGWVNASRRTRGLFAYVPQGNTLISGTLKENLTLFGENVSDAQIMSAARAACIEELVTELGFDAVLGERGIGLSEGQAQRVAVARALLSGAPILLLDEATGALDDDTEARLLQNLSEMRDKTCIIVTHRKAALAICGKRLHIEEGKFTA